MRAEFSVARQHVILRTSLSPSGRLTFAQSHLSQSRFSNHFAACNRDGCDAITLRAVPTNVSTSFRRVESDMTPIISSLYDAPRLVAVPVVFFAPQPLPTSYHEPESRILMPTTRPRLPLSETQNQMASVLGQILAKAFIDETCPARQSPPDIRNSESGAMSRLRKKQGTTESPE